MSPQQQKVIAAGIMALANGPFPSRLLAVVYRKQGIAAPHAHAYVHTHALPQSPKLLSFEDACLTQSDQDRAFCRSSISVRHVEVAILERGERTNVSSTRMFVRNNTHPTALPQSG